MATPISHVVLSKDIYKKYFSDKDASDFFLGTLFPDIRYLGVIKREETHYTGISLDDLKKENSFQAGLKLHSLVDLVREKFIVDNKVYSFYPDLPYITESLKIYEDMVLYDQVDNWNFYSTLLTKISPAEKEFGINIEVLSRWHDILKRYFSQRPDKNSVKNLILAMGFDDNVAREVISSVEIIKNNKQVIGIIQTMHKDFNSLIK